MIDILLATFNGAAHLRQQVESLRAQDCSDWRLLVRDDGSRDGTAEVLTALADELGDRLRILPGGDRPLGAAGNFAELLRISSAEYLMLCDQDDVWLPGKVTATLKKMRELEAERGKDTPLLVHTDFKVVDAQLKVLAESGWRYQRTDPSRVGLNQLLVQNVATGCTVMINRPLRDLALPLPAAAVMHDWWLTLVAAAFGGIGAVAAPLLLYRQHGINTVGAQARDIFSFVKLMRSLREVREGFARTQGQAEAFLSRFGRRLTPEEARMVHAYAHLGQKGWGARKASLLRHRFFHAGFLRKVGMLILR